MGFLCALSPVGAQAQDLAPRSFWPAPVGTKVVVFGYAYKSGDVLLDPSIPAVGVDSRIHTALAGFLSTFDLWGRTANVLLELPYANGTTQGTLNGSPAQRDFAGFGDAGFSLTINLVGAPAMTVADFQALRADPHPILGLSVKVVPPTGQYDDQRLINIGANRWATRLKLGSIIPLQPKWLLEADVSAWFFGDDDDYLNGKREQEPIYAAEVHLVRRFSPGFWASLEYNFFIGGRQTVGGEQQSNEQRNSRIGLTLVKPFLGRNAIKLGYSKGSRTRFGNDYDQVLVSYTRVLE